MDDFMNVDDTLNIDEEGVVSQRLYPSGGMTVDPDEGVSIDTDSFLRRATWASYTPSIRAVGVAGTALTVSSLGEYLISGDQVFFSNYYIFGGAASAVGTMYFDLPLLADSPRSPAISYYAVEGVMELFDASATASVTYNIFSSGNTRFVYAASPSGTLVSDTSPWTVASGDSITITGSYRMSI